MNLNANEIIEPEPVKQGYGVKAGFGDDPVGARAIIEDFHERKFK
jgi:hypothetical protein